MLTCSPKAYKLRHFRKGNLGRLGTNDELGSGRILYSDGRRCISVGSSDSTLHIPQLSHFALNSLHCLFMVDPSIGEEPCHLLKLSGDALALILGLVDDSSLPRLLLLSGCAQLAAKSSRNIMYLKHNISTSNDTYYSPITFIQTLPHLVALHLVCTDPLEYIPPPPISLDDLVSLPRSLVQLRLHYPSVAQTICPDQCSEEVLQGPLVFRIGTKAQANFKVLFPELKVLELVGKSKIFNAAHRQPQSFRDTKIFFSSLPLGLESLQISNNSVDTYPDAFLQISAPCLHTLRMGVNWMRPDLDLSLLPHLTYLEWSSLTAKMASKLPHGLLTLHVHAVDALERTLVLPPSLTTLLLPSAFVDKDVILPKTITSATTSVNYSTLPHLRSLRTRARNNDLLKLPADLEHLICKAAPNDLVEYDLRLLPRKLTSLKLHLDTLRIRKLDALPPNLTSLSIQFADEEDLVQLVKHLRPSVTHLDLRLRYLSDFSALAKLPTSLRSLAIHDCKIPEEYFKHLYGSLLHLRANIVLETDPSSGHLQERFRATLPPILRAGYRGTVSVPTKSGA